MFSRFRMKVALFFHFLVLVEFSSQIPPQEARYAATLLFEQCPRHWIIAHKIKIYIMNTTSIFWVIFYKLYFCTWLSLSALLLFFKKKCPPLIFSGIWSVQRLLCWISTIQFSFKNIFLFFVLIYFKSPMYQMTNQLVADL